MKLFLYTGNDCHLCDQAKHLLESLPPEKSVTVSMRNVRENSDWYHLYGARIPVITKQNAEQELAWPFTLEQIEQFLA